MYSRILLSLFVGCICAQADISPCIPSESVESLTGLTSFDPYNIHYLKNTNSPFSVEAVVGPIDAYLPEEYVFVDDNESFGELELSEADLEGPGHESIISDLVDKTKALLVKIKDYIVSKVRNIINNINKIEVHAKVLIEAGQASFKRKLDQVINKAKEAIKKKIAELKKDVGACLADSEKQFKELIRTFLVNELHCATDEFHKAFDIARNTKNAILTAIKRVETLPGEIATCLQGDNKFSCIKKDVWDVAKTEEEAFKNFVSQFTSAAVFVTGFEVRVAACALDHLGKAGEASFNVVEKFPECVIDKVLKTK